MGNKQSYLSVYLECPLALYMTKAMSPKADIKIVLVNHLDPGSSFTKFSTGHHYTAAEIDWGFTSFMALNTLNDPLQGFIAADDSIKLRVEVTVLQEEDAQRAVTGCPHDAHLYCNVWVVTDQDLKDQIGKTHHLDLVDFRKLPAAAVLRLKIDTPFAAVKALVAERLGVPEEEQRFWVWVKRRNGTVRPSQALSAVDESRALLELRHHRTTWTNRPPGRQDALVDMPLFLERVCPPVSYHHSAVYEHVDLRADAIALKEILLFVKLYNPHTEELTYIGRAHFRKATRVSQLVVPLLRLAQLEPTLQDSVHIYEEVKSEPKIMCERLPPRSTLVANQLEDGDILCLQCGPTPEQQAQLRHPTIFEFLTYVRTRRLVGLRDLSEPNQAGATLEMSTEMSYEEVTKAITQQLERSPPVDAACLRLTQHEVASQGLCTTPVKWGRSPKLGAMLQPSGNFGDHILYYEVLSAPLVHVEPHPELCCPTTHMLMEDPVTTEDGHAYSRAAIEQWLTTSRISPSTGLRLESTVVRPCFALRGLVDRWCAEHGL